MPYNPFGYPAYMAPNNIPSGTNDIQGVRWVASIDEVRAFSVPYGIREIFMKQDEQVFYIKDYTGNIRMFTFEEVEQPKPENIVTRKEFEELKAKYESLIQQQSTANQFQSAQPVAVNASNAELPGNTGASQAGVLQPNSGYESNGIPVEQPIGQY